MYVEKPSEWDVFDFDSQSSKTSEKSEVFVDPVWTRSLAYT